ncbi:hypothetical protein B0J15DRAFT_530789 [Fusarium solani]|uniref:Uncharacterized protein n=1 Tax=Fusarium solani TaxID=169388 RepID=A0A9P9G0G0_FUSSL|nr:uncharacterized protein B0J15DRAFT_530789 [Fusarium solani]KAH7228645.1 hypothetical protein B0J15DRAFT_530789 [Fusarium solani]
MCQACHENGPASVSGVPIASYLAKARAKQPFRLRLCHEPQASIFLALNRHGAAPTLTLRDNPALCQLLWEDVGLDFAYQYGMRNTVLARKWGAFIQVGDTRCLWDNEIVAAHFSSQEKVLQRIKTKREEAAKVAREREAKETEPSTPSRPNRSSGAAFSRQTPPRASQRGLRPPQTPSRTTIRRRGPGAQTPTSSRNMGMTGQRLSRSQDTPRTRRHTFSGTIFDVPPPKMGPLEELAQSVERMGLDDSPLLNTSVRQSFGNEAQPEASLTNLINTLSAPQPASHRHGRLRSPIHLPTPPSPTNVGSEAQSPVANWFKVGQDTGQFPSKKPLRSHRRSSSALPGTGNQRSGGTHPMRLDLARPARTPLKRQGTATRHETGTSTPIPKRRKTVSFANQKAEQAMH